MLNIKNPKTILTVSFVTIITVSVLGTVVYILCQTGHLQFTPEDSNNQTNTQLQYTTTGSTQSEGIYITDVTEIVENAMPAIVAITSKTLITSGNFGPFSSNEKQYSEGAGSGIIVAENDKQIFILTNNHVVEDSNELTVQFIDGECIDAKIIGASERNDIAVVAVDNDRLKSETLDKIKIATLGDSDNLKVGNGIIAIGNALGYGQSVTTGVVSALDREVSSNDSLIDMIQIDAAINGGNSGGALLNNQGEVVGINTAKYSSSGLTSIASIEGMGFAIPISDIADLIRDLIDGKGDTSGVLLGIEGYMTNTANSSGYNLPVGFYISKINDNSTAEQAGLEIGNIITEIDGKSIAKFSTLQSTLTKKKKGDKSILKVKYVKGREYLEKEIEVSF